MHSKIILFLFLFLSLSQAVFASDYYLNAAGNDASAGTSPALAWRTTARIRAVRLQPGDRVLLAGGQVFRGGIWLSSGSRGTAGQPVVFRSYGTGRATVQSDSAFGFYAHNAAGIEVRQLNFVGAGRLRNGNSGVIFHLDSANAHLQHLRLDSLSVSGYRNAGVSIGSWNGSSGYADVRVTNCELRANGETGLNSYAYYPAQGHAHHNWYVAHCTAFDNAGRADVTTTHTGSGIVLSGIDGAVIEKCLAYHNGWLNANPGGGPVGIWGWGCNNLVIQECESHHNLSGTTKDGGGFDLDGGCTNSVLQYNYSHDNQGPGYLLAQFTGAPAMHDLTVRYNISENDARQHDQGAIELYSSGASGGIVRADIHNNTVYLSPPANGSTPKAVYVLGGGVSGIALRNNILQTAAGLPVLATGTATGLRFEGNCYWTPSAALQLDWNGTRYATLAAWRAATGQELLSPGGRVVGLCADPLLVVAGAQAAPTAALAGYHLRSGSALVGAGLGLSAEFNLNPGRRDFFGNPTPAAGVRGNVGASEARSVLRSWPANGPAGGSKWCQVYPTAVHDEFRVASEQVLSQPVEMLLFDLLGRQCRAWSRPGSALRAGGVALPVAGLAAGHYVLRLRSGGQQQRQSLVVAAE